MRNPKAEFWAWLEKELPVDPDLYLISCDLGHPHLQRLAEQYPDRVINIGIREQHAVGLAIGLARGGKWPIVYGVGVQLVYRAAEQLRFARLNEAGIMLVGTGHKDSYKMAGPSHNSDEVGNILNSEGLRWKVYTGRGDIADLIEVLAEFDDRPTYLGLA